MRRAQVGGPPLTGRPQDPMIQWLTAAVLELQDASHVDTSEEILAAAAAAATAADAAFLRRDGTLSMSGDLDMDSNDIVDVTTINGKTLYGTNSALTATTSGTSVDITGIPAGVTQVVVSFAGVSTNGASLVLTQLGDSGGVETAGYTAGVFTSGGDSASTAGFPLVSSAAAAVRHGAFILTLMDAATNLWSCSGTVVDTAGVTGGTAGTKALSATLDRIRLTTAGGVDTFDAGSMSVQYRF